MADFFRVDIGWLMDDFFQVIAYIIFWKLFIKYEWWILNCKSLL
jgi:hypothetical protein